MVWGRDEWAPASTSRLGKAQDEISSHEKEDKKHVLIVRALSHADQDAIVTAGSPSRSCAPRYDTPK